MQSKRKYKVARSAGNNAGPRNFHKWAKWCEGDYIIGKFTKTTIDSYQKKCPIISIEEAHLSNPVTDKDEKPVGEIVGKNLQLNSCTELAKLFFPKSEEGEERDYVPQIGDIIQVTYEGASEIQKGPYKGKDYHVMSVDLLVDEEEEEEDDVL